MNIDKICPYTNQQCTAQVGCSENICSIIEVAKHQDGQPMKLLENNPVEFSFSKQEMDKGFGLFILQAVKELNRDYVLQLSMKKEGSYTHVIVICPTTNFAMAYYALGRLTAKKVIAAGRVKKRK